MVDEVFYAEDGQTPLTTEEQQGLRISGVATRGDLNSVERLNIEAGAVWARAYRRPNFTAELFLKRLHREMFGQVWDWAGEFRRTNKNIGCEWYQVPVEMRRLVSEVKGWLALKSYSLDETAARYHHRLVQIHPFPNGNGRHARLVADLLLERRGAPPFTWGSGLGLTLPALRQHYIEALRAADHHDCARLLEFVRG